MKYFIGIIVGSFFGVYSQRSGGFIIGGVVAYLLILFLELKSKTASLEGEIKQLKGNQQQIPNEPMASHQSEARQNIPDASQIPSSAAKIENSSMASQILPSESVKEDDEIILEAELEPISEPNDIQEVPDNEGVVVDVVLQEEINAEEVEGTVQQQESPETEENREVLLVTNPTPDYIDRAINKLKSAVVAYFTGGNSLVRTGMLVLFIGVAFLLKYVAERTVVPVEFRYIGVSIASLAMLFMGWKLRNKRAGFALSLEGGGIGLLYLTLFAAMRIHHLIDPHIVLILLVAIVVLSSIIAIFEDSMALAIIGMIGGFAAPILTSTGSGSHVQLFSYYLLLNLGVFAMAWFKSWRILNVVGFVATFGIGSLWGYKYYKPEFLMSVEPFLIAYFLLYTIIAVLFALKQPPKLKGINDGTIIFGTPLVGFALQAALMKDSVYGLAYSALALGVFYVLFALFIKRMNKPYMKNLIESFVALGIGFSTLAIPLGFDGRVTSAMWVAEGSALLWVGVRQLRVFPRFSGYGLTLFGMIAFFVENNSVVGSIPWLNADYIGTLIITLATVFIGLYVRAHAKKLLPVESELIPQGMIIVASIWWLYGGMTEINTQYLDLQFILVELFLVLTTVLLLFFANKISYGLLRVLSILTALIFIPVVFAILPVINTQELVFLNQRFAGLMVFSLFHLLLSWYWGSDKRQLLSESFVYVSRLFLITGLFIWLYAFSLELIAYYPNEKFVLLELFMSVTVFILLFLGRYLKISSYQQASVVVTFLMLWPLVLLPKPSPQDMPIINILFMGLLIYSLTHYFVSWFLQKNKSLAPSHWQLQASTAFLVMALTAWSLSGINELKIHLAKEFFLNGILLFMTLSFVSWVILAFKLRWKALHLVRYAYLPQLFILAFFVIIGGKTFHADYGLLFWLLAVVVNYWLLCLYDGSKDYMILKSSWYHIFSLLLFSFIIVYEWAQLIETTLHKESIWYHASTASMLLLIVFGLFASRLLNIWPFKSQFNAYFRQSLPFLAAILWLIIIGMNLSTPGNLSLIPYLPVFNAIDLTGILFVLLIWNILNSEKVALNIVLDKNTCQYILIALAITAFLILNATMLRSFHFWYGIPYKWTTMISSFLIQSGFSILWSLTAVVLMVLAAHKKWRRVWLIGLGLLIAVVVKLFLVDMSASGTVERIVAFLSVGILLSLVGYFSPLPPDQNKAGVAQQIADEES